MTEQDFAHSHEAGCVGRRLSRHVHEVIETGEDIPVGTDNASIRDGLVEMTRKGLGMTAIVNDEHRLCGIFTDGDLRRVLDNGVDVHTTRIIDCMTADFTSCVKSSTAEEALQLMTDGRFRHLPVVEDGVLVGLISIGDVVKARLTEIESEKSAMVDMIRGY